MFQNMFFAQKADRKQKADSLAGACGIARARAIDKMSST